MASAAGSLFARTYAGHTGVDPYTTAVSDVYQDLFDEGIFTGKGLYDVDAFAAALEGRVPENALLSHDLFEGLYARTALVTDVEVVDDYPSSVLAHARRQHRWVRGDWQILWWLFPFVPSPYGSAAQSPAAHLALEDPRQPAAQPDGAGDGGRCSCSAGPSCRARRSPGRRSVSPRSRCRSCLRLLQLLGGPAPAGIGAGVPASRASRISTPTPSASSLQLAFLANQAYEMLHAITVTLVRLGDHASTGCSSGRRRRPAPTAAGRRA